MPVTPAHILLISSYLNVPGGYEKMVVSAANLFVQKGHRVTLLILDNTSELFYPLDGAVIVQQIHLHFGITSSGSKLSRKLLFVQHLYRLRRLIKNVQPDFIISSEYQFAIAAVLCSAGKKAQIFSWEHHHFGVQIRNRFWQYLFRKTYPYLDAVVALNYDECKLYEPFNKRATVIPNFINRRFHQPAKEVNAANLLTVTRLNYIKGIDLLMQTAAIVLNKMPSLVWKVIGYGEQEEQLKRFIENENLQGRLIYEPAQEYDIEAAYNDASVFVLTSRNECFPLTLLEALRSGLPCVSFDCDTGPRHIISHNKNGLLVPAENCPALAEAILFLCNNGKELSHMGEEAFKSSENFYPEAVYPFWKKLFQRRLFEG